MYNKGFIYSFWDKNNTLLYIGKTEDTLLNRLRTHTHCDKEVYKLTTNIKFFHCENPIVLDVIEKILIGTLEPIYNIKDYYNQEDIIDFVKQVNFHYEYSWQELPNEIFSFNLPSLTKEEIKERQRQGIEKAKQEGKYKGRKPLAFKRSEFARLIPYNLSGEKTAKSIQHDLNISPTTFYRWKQQFEKGELI